MPERRPEINPERADHLEILLQRAFIVAGIYMGPEMSPSHIGDYLLYRDMESEPDLTYLEVLRRHMNSENVDGGLQFLIAAIWSELYGVGDAESLMKGLEQTSRRIASRKVGSVQRVGVVRTEWKDTFST